jgi:hypothetical protein
MKKAFGILIGLLVITSLIVLVSAPCSSAGSEQKDPADIVMKACSACHDTGKVCKYLGKKDKEAWLKVVNRMVRKGAAVDQADIPLVADYLAGLEPGSKPVCK